MPLFLQATRPIKGIFGRPLWGVLLCGMTNVMLYERGGGLLEGHLGPFILCLVALPVIAGILTPDKPFFTVVILALGSVPPLNDVPPISIGLWPFYVAIFERIEWLPWLVEVPIALAFTAIAFIVMSVPYAALVGVGFTARLTLIRRRLE